MATNNISFRGEINEMSAAYFIREMECLPARSVANIYLHTPGGLIYDGGEMVNALRAACRRGCKFDITVGALCASMGASLLAAARANGARVHCHNNTEVMFHGCLGFAVGGADELTDQAKAMRDFNESVQRDLKRCGIEDVESWFAADRMKFLNAIELQELGLVDDILDAEAADPDLKQDALKIAAKYNHKQETPKMDEPKNEAETPVEDAPAVEQPTEAAPAVEEAKPAEGTSAEVVPEAPAESVAPTADEIEAKVTELANKRFAGLQSAHDQMVNGLKNDILNLTKERDEALEGLKAANATVTSIQGDVEKLEHDLADVRDQLAKSESVRESVVASALACDEADNSWGARYRAAKRNY